MSGLKNNDLTILVVSYDGYSDMWPDFFNCKRINWPDCPYRTVLANNELKPEFEGVDIVNCGKEALWSDRTRMALQQIDTKYVCFLLEDFYIAERVDNEAIHQALTFMESESIKYYKLDTLNRIETPRYKDSLYLRVLSADLKYGISLMSAIWEKAFFMEKIGEGNYNPWLFEINRNKEAACAGHETVGVYDERDILHICHMVIQGKYIPSAIRQMKKRGYQFIDLTRDKLSFREYAINDLKKAYILLQRRLPFLEKIIKPLFKQYSVSDKFDNK